VIPEGDAIVPVVDVPFDATVRPPGSKSITNRALICAALADGTSTLSNALFADDTRFMLANLAALGFEVQSDEAAATVRVVGQGGNIPAKSADLFCGNSGTTIRFLAALLSLGHGSFTLDGIERMRQRPIGRLVNMLRNLGVRVSFLGDDGFPPLRIDADGLPGGHCRYGAEMSSQYLSAVMMAAPFARHELRVHLAAGQTSWPYIEMTGRLMGEFGIWPEVRRDRDTGEPIELIVPQDVYQPADLAIEPDASAATYFMALAALHENSRITLPGLGRQSMQGDVRFAELMKRAGAEVEVSDDAVTVRGTGKFRGLDADFGRMPDAAQTFAAAAVFADGPSTLRGLHTLAVKETDRITALATELQKLGATVTATADTLQITPPSTVQPARIATYDDHRMAMSFALVGTRVAGIVVEDAGCVAKTYPHFFADLRAAVE
jgi:3-phosphoshikimate 1-carboxyvinyltransferase